MSIFVRRYLNRSRSVEVLVEDWKFKHNHAMFALDVEELVSECIDLGTLSKHAWKSLRDLLFSDPNGKNIDESGNIMKKALTKTLMVFQIVQVLIAAAKRRGIAIKDVADFELLCHETQKIKDEAETCFPPLDMKMVEESLAAYRRGEYHFSEDLLREAQNGNFPPH